AASQELAAQIEAQQAQATELTEPIQTMTAELANLQQQRQAAEADVAASQDLVARIEAQQAQATELTEQIQTMTAEMADLQQQREATVEPQPEPVEEPEPAAPVVAAESGEALPPRDADQVDAVLATTPGLPQAPAARGRLRDLLIDGQCAIDALREVQNPINRQALLVLVNQLDGC
ncbi:MAG: hypothetical protein ACU0DM_11515, partial [Paracoccus sp. (in: a-proteobacteria)]